MKNDLIKSLKLIRFCTSRRTNIVLLIIFLILGVMLEILGSTGLLLLNEAFPVGGGAIFLLCTAIFPSQMIVSVDVSLLAQTSPYKKKLQTTLFSWILLVSMLCAMTLILVIRCVGTALRHAPMKELNFLPVGLFAAGIILYSGVAYKFFIGSVVALYVAMIAGGAAYGYMGAADIQIGWLDRIGANPAVCVVLSYVLIAAATGLEYLISQALYRFPLSKYALRCSRGNG